MTVEWPERLNDDLRWILGRPNFWCGRFAKVLRKEGADIKERAEDEQAAVIHWMLNFYFRYGDTWREAIEGNIREMIEAQGAHSPTEE